MKFLNEEDKETNRTETLQMRQSLNSNDGTTHQAWIGRSHLLSSTVFPSPMLFLNCHYELSYINYMMWRGVRRDEQKPTKFTTNGVFLSLITAVAVI
jgi:hypothetical protein